jgi:DNA polymerase
MDIEARLRRYLEQRRELGEKEFVLDGMSVEEVMRLIGASASGTTPPSGSASATSRDQPSRRPPGSAADRAEPPHAEPPRAEPPREAPEPTDSAPAGDWRAQLGAADAPPPPAAPSGLVIGGGDAELFGGPIERAGSVVEIATMVEQCTRCPLYKTARHAVPGEGSPTAAVMCVGEAPGATEDETGRPFVGAAGQLLTKVLAAINLRREDVFITNVLKHRPPGNRNPLPDEVTACRPYLVRQVELIRPKVIIAFGTFAAQSLLETKLALGKLRGAVHRYHDIPVVVTYHPAALLRNPAWKRPTWEDVQLARRILDSATA